MSAVEIPDTLANWYYLFVLAVRDKYGPTKQRKLWAWKVLFSKLEFGAIVERINATWIDPAFELYTEGDLIKVRPIPPEP